VELRLHRERERERERERSCLAERDRELSPFGPPTPRRSQTRRRNSLGGGGGNGCARYATQYVLDPARGKQPCDFTSRAHRPLRLLFQGSVNRNVAEHNSRLEAERRLLPVLAGRETDDMVFGTFSSQSGLSGMQSSVFCLSLHGKNGGWAQRDLMGMLEGCVPVWALGNTSVTYEELFAPQSYGVLTHEAALAELPRVLDDMSEARVEQLRHAPCVLCTCVEERDCGA
jgi:hypothetical protein